MFRLLMLGDIVGKPGRVILRDKLAGLQDELKPDLTIANGENAAGGLGINPRTAQEIFDAGVELITTGNHIWQKREVQSYLDKHKDTIIRPLNFPEGAPGSGWMTWQGDIKVGVMNALGRVFIPDLVDCPFRSVEQVLERELGDCDITMLDFHAEATSEKVAMGHFLDGRVSLVVGTHTHVQTADARILPGGTAYISDLGMCGPINSVIGVSTETVLSRFLTARPSKFEVAKGAAMINGVCVDFDESSGKAVKIERVYRLDE